MRSGDARRPRGGFTLVELMVALVISGLVMATVFQILNGQSRAVAVQGAREETQQNVRGALEIISGELRTAFPQGILRADSSAITFMQPRAWGLVCGSNGPNSIDAIFPSTQALGAFSAGSGVLVNTGAPDWRPRPAADAGARATVTGLQTLGNGEAGACAGAAPNNVGASGDVVSVRITADWPIAGLVGNLAAAERREVMLYSMAQYDVAQSGGRWWLRRGGQPLAGPLARAQDFGFTYHAADPTVPVAPPGAAAAQLQALRMVRVRIATESQQKPSNDQPQRDSGTVMVMLRNAP